MPDNDPVLNCASGACCRLGSPEQIGALAQIIGQTGVADDDTCYRIARHLTAEGLIGLPIAGAAFARWVRWSLTQPSSDPIVPGGKA